MKRSRARGKLVVTADGRGVASHAGARLLLDLADAVGLTEGMSAAMAATKQRRRGHDRGEVLVDVAVMIADGGEAISDLAVLRDQPELFGQVASTPTAWRTLEAVDAEVLKRVASARAAARAEVWAAGADPGFYVIDFNATLVTAHSDKAGAAPNYKRGFGFHPLLAFLDATDEALAGILRPGNAGSKTAADHVELLAGWSGPARACRCWPTAASRCRSRTSTPTASVPWRQRCTAGAVRPPTLADWARWRRSGDGQLPTERSPSPLSPKRRHGGSPAHRWRGPACGGLR